MSKRDMVWIVFVLLLVSMFIYSVSYDYERWLQYHPNDKNIFCQDGYDFNQNRNESILDYSKCCKECI